MHSRIGDDGYEKSIIFQIIILTSGRVARASAGKNRGRF